MTFDCVTTLVLKAFALGHEAFDSALPSFGQHLALECGAFRPMRLFDELDPDRKTCAEFPLEQLIFQKLELTQKPVHCGGYRKMAAFSGNCGSSAFMANKIQLECVAFLVEMAPPTNRIH